MDARAPSARCRRGACAVLIAGSTLTLLPVEPRRAARRPAWRSSATALGGALGARRGSRRGGRRGGLRAGGERRRPRLEQLARHPQQRPRRAWSGGASSWRRTGRASGYGSGSFQDEFAQRYLDVDEPAGRAISHSEPVTVAAEQGRAGLLVVRWRSCWPRFAALLGTAPLIPAPRAALVACFVAMVVHSLAYAGLLIDR